MKPLTAKQFREIRENVLGMSRKEFAEAFGFTPRHVRNLENGESDVSDKNTKLMILAKIVKEYGLFDLEELRK